MVKIYLDTGNLEEIATMKSTGIIKGVTTNPILIKKYLDSKNIQFNDYILKLLDTTKELQVFIQPIANNIEQFISEAERIICFGTEYIKNKYGLEANIVIKVPLRICDQEQYLDGLIIINELCNKKNKNYHYEINASAIMSPEQAILASLAGADYLSLFTGNVDDFIRSKLHMKFEKDDYFGKDIISKIDSYYSDEGILCGEDLVDKTIDLKNKLHLKSKILVAGVRNRRAFRNYLMKEVDIITVPTRVFIDILSHPKTLEFGIDCYNSKSWFER
jgi:transaldolase